MSDSDSLSEHGKGDRSGGRRSGNTDDKELDSRALVIQSKRFYVDIKQNWRGRYIKIAESMMSGGGSHYMNRRKSRIILSMSVSEAFVKMLAKCEELGIKPDDTKKITDEVTLHSQDLKDDDRAYRCEYKENSRGRFLHVEMTTDTVTFGAARQVRPVINVPASGLPELRSELRALLTKWDKDLPPDNSYKGPMPEQKSMRVGNKTYYFDYGQNQRGVFMRVSEVKPQWRTAITIPQGEWIRFAQIFQDAAKIVDVKTEVN